MHRIGCYEKDLVDCILSYVRRRYIHPMVRLFHAYYVTPVESPYSVKVVMFSYTEHYRFCESRRNVLDVKDVLFIE